MTTQDTNTTENPALLKLSQNGIFIILLPLHNNLVFVKKITLSLIAITTLSTVSCKKNYNCVCTYTISGVSTTLPTVVVNGTKSQATSACTANESTLNTYGTGVSLSCAIQ